MASAKEQAQQHVTDLRGRMEAFFRGELSEDDLRKAQRRTLDSIRESDSEADVLRILVQGGA